MVEPPTLNRQVRGSSPRRPTALPLWSSGYDSGVRSRERRFDSCRGHRSSQCANLSLRSHLPGGDYGAGGSHTVIPTGDDEGWLCCFTVCDVDPVYEGLHDAAEDFDAAGAGCGLDVVAQGLQVRCVGHLGHGGLVDEECELVAPGALLGAVGGELPHPG